jgi:hypothetical protein
LIAIKSLENRNKSKIKINFEQYNAGTGHFLYKILLYNDIIEIKSGQWDEDYSMSDWEILIFI